jgi:hypothetical protein
MGARIEGLELADSDHAPRALFRCLLLLSDEEPHDPPVYLSEIPNWSVGDPSRGCSKTRPTSPS